MAYAISSDCIGCGSCLDVCPAGAITEGSPFEIDEDACIECGACEGQCPTGAISLD